MQICSCPCENSSYSYIHHMEFIRYTLEAHDIFVVDMKKDSGFPFSELAEKTIQKFISEGKRITLIGTRKWFAWGMICRTCWHIPHCTHCDIPVSYHKTLQWGMIWLCHICKRQYSADAICTTCWWHEVDLYGIWTQQLAEYIKQKFGIQSVVVESERTNSPKKMQQLTQELASAQIIIWTWLLAQPSPAFSTHTVIVLNADSGLWSPDYQVNRNQYTYLTELFKNYASTPIIIQTHNAEHPTLLAACTGDHTSYQKRELNYRKKLNYPPYTEICMLLYKHEIETRLFSHVNTLYQELLYLKELYKQKDLEIYSTPPLVYKMFWKYRYHLILKWPQLRQFMDIARSKLKIAQKWFKMDWEPKNIL